MEKLITHTNYFHHLLCIDGTRIKVLRYTGRRVFFGILTEWKYHGEIALFEVPELESDSAALMGKIQLFLVRDFIDFISGQQIKITKIANAKKIIQSII